jgi:hypothetical protein
VYPHGSSHQLPLLPLSSSECSSSVLSLLLSNQIFVLTSTRKPYSPLEYLLPRITFQKPSTISTGRLQTLLSFHLRPIQLVVSQRSYFLIEMGSLILRSVSHLDAFSGYQLRRLLLGCATGVTTDSQALRPPRSSRTRGSAPQTPYAHSG